MKPAKSSTPAKPQKSPKPVKDLRPEKDARGGAQKKEILEPMPQAGSGPT